MTGTEGEVVLSRRHWLSALTRLACLPVASNLLGCTVGSESPPVVLGASNSPEGSHAIQRWHKGGADAQPFAQRGHGVAVSSAADTFVFFDRRPGNSFSVLHAHSFEIAQRVLMPANVHGMGHGDYSRDGRYLYVAESRFSEQALQADAVVGVYECAAGFKRVGEIPLPVVGIHELRAMPDGEHLVIAVGGILTHPTKPREKLNLSTMQGELIYVSLAAAAVVERHLAPHPRLSLRHLDVDQAGGVVVAAQFQPQDDGRSSEEKALPLLFSHRMGEPLRSFSSKYWPASNGYVASVAVDPLGQLVLITEPRANQLTLWSVGQGRRLAVHQVPDVAGVDWSPSARAFIVSSGAGQLLEVTLQGIKLLALTPDRYWDNHLLAT